MDQVKEKRILLNRSLLPKKPLIVKINGNVYDRNGNFTGLRVSKKVVKYLQSRQKV